MPGPVETGKPLLKKALTVNWSRCSVENIAVEWICCLSLVKILSLSHTSSMKLRMIFGYFEAWGVQPLKDPMEYPGATLEHHTYYM